MDQELRQLILEAKQGNTESFAQLMSRFKGHVFRQAYAMLHDPAEAQDVSQEAFIKAYYSLEALQNEYAFSSWIARIVSRLCHDRIQKKRKEEVIEREHILKESTHSKSMDHLLLRIHLEEAMQKLSPEHREIIVLRDIQGFTYDEIAEILQIPVGTVKSRIHVARLTLRNELSK
ncbi:RNA polymerase sigma-70 factor (ECF subfamily) [Anoxybacillus tepidamans]|uniref:RNA polymerase sigma-70 factor (ECF subfamily) n=1 Tax=Anoxybacteroides tepidamans TaxID=265948 RepID=A0A7W8IT21_9BACL|nr:sigma-70 family RNA polymerase sigma factor [Anoxybacillus tepidamans]MBB5326225.1 RNA polymerase sigma-70 factor (ECF subfamily) [Anoxybacillus tepidamans]